MPAALRLKPLPVKSICRSNVLNTVSFHKNTRQKDGWHSQLDPRTGQYYYFNRATQKTQWERPVADDRETQEAKRRAAERDEEEFRAAKRVEEERRAAEAKAEAEA